LDRLEDGVLGEGGGYGYDGAVDRAPVVRDGLVDGVEDGDSVHVAPLAPGRDAPDHLRAPAVVEALARQVDRLAPGDALDDEARGLVDEDAHGGSPPRDIRPRVLRMAIGLRPLESHGEARRLVQ